MGPLYVFIFSTARDALLLPPPLLVPVPLAILKTPTPRIPFVKSLYAMAKSRETLTLKFNTKL